MIDLRLGDSLELMREMPDESVDAVITDPPYPELKGGLVHRGRGVTNVIHESVTVGTPWNTSLDWIDEAFRICKYGMMVFCSWHSLDTVKQKLRSSAIGLVTWHKRNSSLPINNVPHFTTEFVWLFKKSPGLEWNRLETFYDIPGLAAGCMATERVLMPNSGVAAHPAQKPESLMMHLLACGPKSVLDPFMGTGTTGSACVKLGINFTGYELDPSYFAIAQRRIEEARAQPSLFVAQHEQITLDTAPAA